MRSVAYGSRGNCRITRHSFSFWIECDFNFFLLALLFTRLTFRYCHTAAVSPWHGGKRFRIHSFSSNVSAYIQFDAMPAYFSVTCGPKTQFDVNYYLEHAAHTHTLSVLSSFAHSHNSTPASRPPPPRRLMQ